MDIAAGLAAVDIAGSIVIVWVVRLVADIVVGFIGIVGFVAGLGGDLKVRWVVWLASVYFYQLDIRTISKILKNRYFEALGLKAHS